MGKRWRDGDRYTGETYHSKYGEKTIYDNHNGFCYVGGSFHEREEAIIFEFNEVDLEH